MVQQTGQLVAVPVEMDDGDDTIEVGHVLNYNSTYDRYTVEYRHEEEWRVSSFPRSMVMEVTSSRAFEAYWMFKRDKYKEVMGYDWGN